MRYFIENTNEQYRTKIIGYIAHHGYMKWFEKNDRVLTGPHSKSKIYFPVE